MKEQDITDLESTLQRSIKKGKSNPVGTSKGDLTGVSLAEAQIMGSPCAILKWCRQNNPKYRFRTFVELDEDGGWQGIKVFDKETGKKVKTIYTDMHGGLDSDPKNVIYATNKMILGILVKKVSNL